MKIKGQMKPTVADSHLALTETLAFLLAGEATWPVNPPKSPGLCCLFCTDGANLANSSLLFASSLSLSSTGSWSS